MPRYLLLLLGSCLLAAPSKGQNEDSLDQLLNEDGKASKEYTTATFKATRIVTGHSIENLAEGVLDFRVAHRFGSLDQGVQNFLGLDNAVTKISFDYGVKKWLMLGIGRSTLDKEYDGFAKVKILRQTRDNAMPISLSYMGAVTVKSLRPGHIPDTANYYFSNRMAYVNQLLIARRFSESFSVQITPTHIHYNIVPYSSDPNDVLAIGAGGRMKLTRRFSLNAEYYYTIPGTKLTGSKNALSVGVDIETGGHVFQLHFTNAIGMNERAFIGQNTDSWDKGQIHFGFNMSRVFTVVKPKELRNMKSGW